MVVVTEGWDAAQRQIVIYSLDHPEKPQQILRPRLPAKRVGDAFFECPNYTHDGKSILFMAASRGKRGNDYDVYRLELERLTEGNGYAGGLKLFADGKTAVFLKWREHRQRTTIGTDVNLLDLQTHKLAHAHLKVNGMN